MRYKHEVLDEANRTIRDTAKQAIEDFIFDAVQKEHEIILPDLTFKEDLVQFFPEDCWYTIYRDGVFNQDELMAMSNVELMLLLGKLHSVFCSER